MKTLFQNSKKCLKAEKIGVSGLLALLTSSIIPEITGAAPRPPHAELTARLLSQIQDTQVHSSFDPLLKNWVSQYGTDAVSPLLDLASDHKISDPQRYIALMGAVKLGGLATLPSILPLLKDSSWMIRSAALRAITALYPPSSAQTLNAELKGKVETEILARLHDPALVVRLEAIQSVETLKPHGAENALVALLGRSENYHHRIAQWVPQRALKALQKLEAVEIAPLLEPYLEHSHDPELQKATRETLERLRQHK